jgi:malate dehydrogenase (oxaloacetate-decarboxylating)(NADP+)
MEPTFGGINLEDIKAPECFAIEERLKERLDIPVFHDDQHGTAIIASAALLNALEVTGRNIEDIRMVVSGAGASAVACTNLCIAFGVRRENILMVDSKGVIYKGRTEGMNEFKEQFANDTSRRTLADAMEGADVFLGLSAKDLVSPEMLLSMADKPIVFAMANPDPEICYDVAKRTRDDVIMATGRSDFPNQVNNVLGFPFIFRGALDVRARGINEEMKMAAVKALAQLAKEPVTDDVRAAYGNADFSFGSEYLIPKPFDPRVLYYVSPAVAKAAMDSGIARTEIDIEEYTLKLKEKTNRGRVMLRGYYNIARKSDKKRIAYSEGANERVLAAAMMAQAEGIAEPVLIGAEEDIREQAAKIDFDLSAVEILDPANNQHYDSFVERYYELRRRKGATRSEAERAPRIENIFSALLLEEGQVDGLICGVDRYFARQVRPIFELIGLREECKTSAALYIVSVADRLLFFADTAINLEMDSDKMAEIAIMSAEFAQSMNITPRVGMLSFSNFGSVRHPSAEMVRRATSIVKSRCPDLMVDGEMQADTAVDPAILKGTYPFSDLQKRANVLVFPDMQSANISYKLLQRLGGARVVGPVILGLNKPAYVLQRHASIDEIFNMTTVAVAQASMLK